MKSLLEQWMRSIKIKSFAIGAILLLGTTTVLNNAYAHNHYDRSPVRMLFKDTDLTVDQRKEVKSIMTSSIKEGRKIREESLEAMDDLKKGTHKKLSSILSEEQMARFDKNSKRMENRKENMRDGKMKRHGKGKKKRGSKRHKGHKKKRR